MAHLLNLLILNPSDDQQTFMDKCNYNWDQILAMGGGAPGFQGFQGIQGIPGLQGIQGIPGPQGTPGSVWFVTSTSTPPSGTPATGDYWFDTSTLDIYQWNGSSWVFSSSLTTSNVFKMAGGGGNQVQYVNPTGRNLVLSNISYAGDTQPGTPFQLKIIGDSGDAGILFGLNELPGSLTATPDGETIDIYQNSIIMTQVNSPDPTYEWEFDNPTYNTIFNNSYSGSASVNSFQINVFDSSFYYGGVPASTFWFNGETGIIFDLTPPSGSVYNKRIEFAQTLTSHPTNNESLHISTVGAEGTAIDNVTFTDYGYMGLSKTTPHYKLDINGGTLGSTAGDVVSLLRLYTEEGSFGTTNKSSSLGISAVKLETGITARSAFRITSFAAQNLFGTNKRRPSSYIQFSDAKNSGVNIGLMRFGVDNTITPDTYDAEGNIVMREEYFYGNDTNGNSGFGTVNNVGPSAYNFVKYYGDNGYWRQTVNIQSNTTSNDLEMQSVADTLGAIHLYQPDGASGGTTPTHTINTFTGITTGGYDGNGTGAQYTTAALLFQGDDGSDGTKVHLMSSAYTDTILRRRLTARGEGQIVIWSHDQSTSSPADDDDYGLMFDVRDHSGGGNIGNSTAIIRNMKIPTSSNLILFEGNGIANTDRAIIFQPNTLGFVGIGGKDAGIAFGTYNDTPQTKLHVDGAVTIGTRKTIANYFTEVGQWSFTHGVNVKSANYSSAIISGLNHNIAAGLGSIYGHHTIIGTQHAQLVENTVGITISPDGVPTTSVVTPMSILSTPIDVTTQSNNRPNFYSHNSYFGNQINALTITIPLNTQLQGTTDDYRTNGIEVERWFNSSTIYSDTKYIPFQISAFDRANVLPIFMDQYQSLSSSLPVLVVDHAGHTAINTVPFNIFTTDSAVTGTELRPTTDFRFINFDASLHVGPAPLVQNGHYVPDAYVPGTPQEGAGSIVISSGRTRTTDTINLLTNNSVLGGFLPNARIQTSGIKTNVNSEIWGTPFEIFPGKAVNLHTGGSAKVHGSMLRISAGSAAADTTGISYGGNLILRGGHGKYGGYTEIKGGSGSTEGAAVFIDAGGPLTGVNTGIVIGKDGLGTASGSDVNVYGQVSMIAAPVACPLLAAFGHSATSGVYTFTNIPNGGSGTVPLNTWQQITSAVSYDRFINITMQMPGGAADWFYTTTSFSVNGVLSVTRCTIVFNNDFLSTIFSSTSLYVPAGSPLSMQFNVINNQLNVHTLYIEVVSTKLGK